MIQMSLFAGAGTERQTLRRGLWTWLGKGGAHWELRPDAYTLPGVAYTPPSVRYTPPGVTYTLPDVTYTLPGVRYTLPSATNNRPA